MRGCHRRWIAGIALLVAVVIATTASATYGEGTTPVPIPARSLELQPRQLPGFEGAKKKVEVFESIDQFVERRHGTRAAIEAERALLMNRGFQGTVGEVFLAPHREAIFVAAVFVSPQGATEEFQETVATDLKRLKGHGVKRSTVKGIPGSVLAGQFEKGHRGGTGNVLFTTGRCFFIVGDAVRRATSRKQAERAPIAAAKGLLRRHKSVCA